MPSVSLQLQGPLHGGLGGTLAPDQIRDRRHGGDVVKLDALHSGQALRNRPTCR
jgi:hypothetical protein